MWVWKRATWYDFAYNLWYPAILGSMIYDIADVPSSAFTAAAYWFKCMILVFYCVDYLFLYGNVRRPVQEQAGWRIALDITIAVLFRIAFSFASRLNYQVSLIFMGLAIFGLVIYLNRSRLERLYMRTLIFVLALVIIVSFIKHVNPHDVAFFTRALAAFLSLYMVYAFFLSEFFTRRLPGGE
jgi:hypothetical protein